jgi:hypothetical protein
MCGTVGVVLPWGMGMLQYSRGDGDKYDMNCDIVAQMRWVEVHIAAAAVIASQARSFKSSELAATNPNATSAAACLFGHTWRDSP